VSTRTRIQQRNNINTNNGSLNKKPKTMDMLVTIKQLYWDKKPKPLKALISSF
jgi:hypothetical protein